MCLFSSHLLLPLLRTNILLSALFSTLFSLCSVAVKFQTNTKSYLVALYMLIYTDLIRAMKTIVQSEGKVLSGIY
jgi:hypothetical protein